MTLIVVKGVNCRFLNVASLLILLTATKHVPLVTMEGKKNSLPSCYSMDTLPDLGAQVKGRHGKCSIKIAYFALTEFVPHPYGSSSSLLVSSVAKSYPIL